MTHRHDHRHYNVCTGHSGAKKEHDWAVNQIADLLRTTTKVTTNQVARSRCQKCGDIELLTFDEPLNDDAAEKIREHRAAYNNRPSNSISFMPAIATTSGRLHCEYVRILFLQAQRETTPSRVEHAKHKKDQFRFHYVSTLASMVIQ